MQNRNRVFLSYSKGLDQDDWKLFKRSEYYQCIKMTSGTHKSSKEICLKKGAGTYKKYLVNEFTRGYQHKLTAEQISKIADNINFSPVELRHNRKKLEKDIKNTISEFIRENKEKNLRINPGLKITIQSRLS